MNDSEALLTICGLAFITVLTRGFFLIPQREVPIPPWLRQGLRYAPLGALVAVAVPEIVMTQGELIHTLCDARLYGALAGGLWFWWRRDILGTIVSGYGVLLALRLTLGW
jgi:branched-subunit amino acid transport protein